MIQPLADFSRRDYVCGNEFVPAIARFRMSIARIGHRVPIGPHERKKHCPLCPYVQLNTEEHLVLDCQSVSAIRGKLGITRFKNLCELQGRGSYAFCYYMNGLDQVGAVSCRDKMLERGTSLQIFEETWLAL